MEFQISTKNMYIAPNIHWTAKICLFPLLTHLFDYFCFYKPHILAHDAVFVNYTLYCR